MLDWLEENIHKVLKITLLSLGVIAMMLLIILIVMNIQLKLIKTDINPNVNAESNEPETLPTPELIRVKIKYDGPTLSEGDKINPKDIIITGIYDNGETKRLSKNIKIPESMTMPVTEGINTFKIKVNDKEYDFEMAIKPKYVFDEKIEEMEKECRLSDYSHISDGLMISIKKTESPDVYFTAHILAKRPPKVISVTNESIDRMTRMDYPLIINGSDVKSASEGFYVREKEILSDTDLTGTEMAISETGKLFTPSKKSDNIKDTIISKGPTLIENGKIVYDKTKPDSGLPKTAIGYVNNNEYYIINATNYSLKSKITTSMITDILYEKGCIYAKMLSDDTNSMLICDNKPIGLTPYKNKKQNIIDVIAFD